MQAICLLLAAVAVDSPARAATGRLALTVVDGESGRPVPCRMHLKTGRPDGRPRKVRGVPYWFDHFVFPGEITLELPLGTYFFEIERGPEYPLLSGHFTLEPFADDSKRIELTHRTDMAAAGWWSGDLDVRRPVREMELLMRAEDLHVAQVVTWWNEKQELEGGSAAGSPLTAFDGDRFYHRGAGGISYPGATLMFYNLPRALKVERPPSEYPPPGHYIEAARKNPQVWIDVTRPYWWDLPMLVACGQVDSVRVVHQQLCRSRVIDNESGGKPRERKLFPGVSGNPRWSQQIYFHLLNCGLRIPPSAGSGSGAAPNPVGYNRVYVQVEGPLSYERWWEGFRAGRVVVTNGPLLRPSVQGYPPGHVFQAAEGETMELSPAMSLSMREPFQYLEVIKNGRVEYSIPLREYQKRQGVLPPVRFQQSGWFLLRVVSDVSTTYRFGMTGPYYVEIGYQPRISRASAQFFLDWVYQRARQIKLADPARQRELIEVHRRARDYWEGILKKSNAK